MQDALFDTHAHLISDDWEKYPPRPLRADLPVPKRTDYTVTAEALIGMMDAHHVPTACVVQRGHLYGHDNSYIMEAARRFPGRLLPVVILDTQDPATPARYTDMVRQQRVRGFRMANTRPSHLDTAWISSPAAMQVWQACADLGTPMAVIIFQNQLAYVLPLLRIIARMFPSLPVLIDHLGTPYGATLVEMNWARDSGVTGALVMPPPPDFGIGEFIRIFEDTPNVHFKLTEVSMERLHETGLSAAPLIRRMADVFGASRLVWGSDVGQSLRWPFDAKAGMGRAAADLLSPQERAQFLHDNAARLYASTK
ncbi:MAG TPA: amidohydrolase family protein [Steroidobacteraceae bacterium]|nr:amidohydrolase family protein [Steroidobacteraceae bacterium]